MKKITIVGTGIGPETLTFEALEAIKRAEVLLGAPRMLEPYENMSKRLYPDYLPDDAAARIKADSAQEFAVLVSGDAGFYSPAAKLCRALSEYRPRLIPGISSASAFFARLRLPWQDAVFISAHGRETDIAGYVRRNRLTFCLTGNNVNEAGSALIRAGYGHIKTYVGENLGTERERVFETSAEELARAQFEPLTVLLFQNEEFDDKIPCGLPDGGFLRLDGVPMTKSETRAVVMSKLRPEPASICYDIGAGTGSVTVEMALSAWRGHIYSIERSERAVSLIRQNCASFHLGNVTAVCGDAPDALGPLPPPDAVFIGGSGGETENIVKAVLDKNANARVVITAVTPETVFLALAAFKNAGKEPDITQINIARGKRVGDLHVMEAQNPITILCAGGMT